MNRQERMKELVELLNKASKAYYQDAEEINREFLEKYPIDLYIPGCPVHPLTFINSVLSFIRNKK